MASEALVDLSYRGLVLGTGVRLLQVGPRSAYVAHDAPMPVGTALVLTVDETLTIPAEVARVREGDAKDGPAGMWLWADAAEDRARAWWDAHVTAEDPRIPEPGSDRIQAQEAVAPAAATPEDQGPAQAVHAVAPTPATMQDDVPPDHDQRAGDEHDQRADDEDDEYAIEIRRAATSAEHDHAGDAAASGTEAAADADEEASPAVQRESDGRQARGTQVMTAIEIADVLGMPPIAEADGDGDGDAAADPPGDPRTTHVMSAIEVEEVLAGGEAGEPAPLDDALARGKARGKRRSRKRR